MADQFQYIKLPDGSYGKFAANASDETIRGAIDRDFPTAYHPTGGAVPGGNAEVPAGLQGAPAPEYKPFFSSDEARDEGSGLLKAGAAGVFAPIAHAVSHIPGAYNDAQRQGVKDLDEYVKPANKGETFGKVAGTAIGALPALYAGGEFLGGVADEVAPAASDALAPLGRVAGSASKAAKLAGLGLGSTAIDAAGHALWDKLKGAF